MNENPILTKEEMTAYTSKAVDYLINNGPRVLLAIVVLFIGLWIIKRISKLAKKAMSIQKFDPSLLTFLTSLLSIGLKVLLIVSVAGMIGIATTSFVAVLGAAGLAVGLSLQGSLANFAGGVLVLLTKPYKLGDFVEMQGVTGTVQEIRIFNTVVLTLDNKTVFMPNGAISNGNIRNYTVEGKLRVDLVAGIGYSEDIRTARDVIMKVMTDHKKVLKDPAPSVNVLELGDNSVNLAIRPYCKPEDYWTVYFEVTEGVKYALDAAGIEIPFPQRDIHIRSGNAGA